MKTLVIKIHFEMDENILEEESTAKNIWLGQCNIPIRLYNI